MIKAIVFDMDGVLIDAKEWHYEALNKALALFGFEISRYDHLTSFDGLPTSTKLNMLSKMSNLPIELHSFINELKQSYTMDMVHEKCRPRFIHEYALSSLRANGYKLGVASNSIRATVQTMMQKADLDDYLDVMLSNEDVEKPKPSPDIYIKAMQQLGFTPAECLIVEDNENGILAARASGAHVLVVSDVDEVNYENIMNAVRRAEGN
ncbi:Phosphorylated carbohydrates phosphatase [compost metagenome]|uniref:HAD family hydrolase n=1 Tax=Pseudomonas sp. Irchel s3a12 TaxID=2009047 RepID=UPI000BA3475C|nr:HAD family phosphatase [Pseudomonas sp. Irchel s3a12]